MDVKLHKRIGAVHFDGAHFKPEHFGDRLVGVIPCEDFAHNVAFSGCERQKALSQLFAVRFVGTDFQRLRNGGRHLWTSSIGLIGFSKKSTAPSCSVWTAIGILP